VAPTPEDRRRRLLGERRPLHSRTGKDERSRGRIHPLAVEFERGSAVPDEVQLLVVALLIVLVEDPISSLATPSTR